MNIIYIASSVNIIHCIIRERYIHCIIRERYVIPVDFIFVEVVNLQVELGYATFSYSEAVLHAVNRAWRGSRGTRMGCTTAADQNLASEREQNDFF